MKWFKHISDSGDDPDIDDAVTKFGAEGYYVFFRTLEIMSREFDVDNPGSNTFTIEFLKRRYRTYHWNRVVNVLTFFDQCGRIKIEYLEKSGVPAIRLTCPKLRDLTDEYTQKELTKKSGQTPDTNRERLPNKKQKQIKEEDKELKANAQLPVDNSKDEGKEELKELFAKVLVKYPSRNWHTWLGSHNRCHPEAILHTLKALMSANGEVENPIAYCDAIINQENQNYNARDFYAKDNSNIPTKREATEALGTILARLDLKK